MTKEQKLYNALNGLKSVLKHYGIEDIKNEVHFKDGTTETIDCLKEIETFIIEYIKETKPKKPIKRYYTTYGSNSKKKRLDIRCPCCNSAFTNGIRNSIGVFQTKEKEFIDSINNQKNCMFCGQALDWSDEDDE